MPIVDVKELEKRIKFQRREAEERDAERRAKRLGFPYLNLSSTKAPFELKAMGTVSEAEARKALLVPLQTIRGKLIVAVVNPELTETRTVLEELKTKYDLQVFVASATSIEHAWNYYEFVPEETKDITGTIEINKTNLDALQKKIKNLSDVAIILEELKNAYTSNIVEAILAGALSLDASDIHLEPEEEKKVIRLRIDGVLHVAYEKLGEFQYKSLVSRIKLLSNLKLNITQEAQDGRFSIKLSDRSVEIRSSVIPSEFGETIVMRVLDPLTLKTNLEELGWRSDDLKIIMEKIAEPNGLILNTGPTGSGKTTTLYAFLRKTYSPEIKVITIEDPIEYHLPGVSQTQVNSDAHYTFASGLRSILRQDPDVILVGEIRDEETAQIAMNASLTGHLVFSTLHTNDAIGAVPRLLDLKVKPQVLGPALSIVIAQRLIRRLCESCKKQKKIDEKMKERVLRFITELPSRIDKSLLSSWTLYEPRGCGACADIGYKGRISVFELFVVDEKIEELIYKNPTEIELFRLARSNGMVTLQEDGLVKALQGITSIEEVERITGNIVWLRS